MDDGDIGAKAFEPEAVGLLNWADEYLYRGDPHGSILKIGCANELITKHIMAIERIDIPSEIRDCQYKCIRFLEDKVNLPEDIIEAMDYIRREKNKAFHENRATEHNARRCLKNAHRILRWCVEHYGGRTSAEYVRLDNFYRPFGVIHQTELTGQ